MRILYISDLHEPVTHPGAFDFIDSVAQRKQPDAVVFIGDIADHHCISRWAKHPHAPGPMDEYELTLSMIQRWYQAFTDATVLIGNHDRRPLRFANDVGIPDIYLKDYAHVWDTPRWNWVEEIIHGTGERAVFSTHGEGRGGINPAYNLAKEMGMSCVMGHVHHTAGVKWFASPVKRWFGLDVGALIDDRLYAFAYSKAQKKKTVLGCGFVDTDDPMETGFIAMPCGRGEKFDREKYPINPLLKGRMA